MRCSQCAERFQQPSVHLSRWAYAVRYALFLHCLQARCLRLHRLCCGILSLLFHCLQTRYLLLYSFCCGVLILVMTILALWTGQFNTWQFGQAGQAELLQEIWSGREKRRAAHSRSAANLGNQAMLEQAGQGPIAIDAAYSLNLRARHWLAIGDHSQRLHSGGSQFGRHWQAQQRSDIASVLWSSHQLHLTSQPLHAYSPALALQLMCEHIQHTRQTCVVNIQQFAQLGIFERATRNKEKAFGCCDQLSDNLRLADLLAALWVLGVLRLSHRSLQILRFAAFPT